jgi:hypothetical protein
MKQANTVNAMSEMVENLFCNAAISPVIIDVIASLISDWGRVYIIFVNNMPEAAFCGIGAGKHAANDYVQSNNHVQLKCINSAGVVSEVDFKQ